MENAVVQQIRKRITRSKFGEIFFVSSFPQYDVEYVTKLLAIFEKEGLITYELVKEIAKRDKAKVIPTGATAANRLGFSTQVPMNTIFLTTGSGRKLKLGNRTVTLKHGAPKNFAFRGRLMPELVQALRNIGEHNITQDVEARIGQLFTETPETDTIEYDLLLAPVWMRQVIKKGIKR